MSVYSFSRNNTHRRCPYQHKLKYDEGLSPKVAAQPLRRGSLIHTGLEACLRARHSGQSKQSSLDAAKCAIDDKYEAWTKEEAITFLFEENPVFALESQEMYETCRSVAERVIVRLELNGDRWTTLEHEGEPLIEKELRVPMNRFEGDEDEYVGFLDWVATDNTTGYTWLIDFKTRKNFNSDEFEEVSPQLGIYQYLAKEMLGIDLKGSAVMQLRAKVPAIPGMTKPTKNHPSRVKRSSISTDWETYKQKVIDEGLDPNDYLDMEEKLTPFERMTFTYRTERETRALWLEECRTASAIGSPERILYRSQNGFNCVRCSYLEPCQAELRGDDVEFIKEQLFTIRPRRAEKKEESDVEDQESK